jgi:hypothetical protein
MDNEIHLWSIMGTLCGLNGQDLNAAQITHDAPSATCQACLKLI